MKINKKKFRAIYYQCLEDILAIRPVNGELKDILAIHDYDYKYYDVENYLEKSWTRAWEIYKLLPDVSEKQKIQILDIGSLFCNFSLCFKRLGYEVVAVDAYKYYGDIFNKLIEFLIQEGVMVNNIDFTVPLSAERQKDKYDVILCLAVLEHLAHSPKSLFENIKQVLAPNGSLVLEVPNIAYWPNRIKLMAGQSILSPIRTIYQSEPPFTGHHHEYTANEIRDLASLSDFKLEKMVFYNYSVSSIIYKLLYFPANLFDSCKELILAKLNIVR